MFVYIETTRNPIIIIALVYMWFHTTVTSVQSLIYYLNYTF